MIQARLKREILIYLALLVIAVMGFFGAFGSTLFDGDGYRGGEVEEQGVEASSLPG